MNSVENVGPRSRPLRHYFDDVISPALTWERETAGFPQFPAPDREPRPSTVGRNRPGSRFSALVFSEGCALRLPMRVLCISKKTAEYKSVQPAAKTAQSTGRSIRSAILSGVSFATLKQFRRIAPRREKTVISFKAFVNLACAMAWIR